MIIISAFYENSECSKRIRGKDDTMPGRRILNAFVSLYRAQKLYHKARRGHPNNFTWGRNSFPYQLSYHDLTLTMNLQNIVLRKIHL